MAIEPTPEQQAAREVFASGRDLALIAGAGTGKTSTLMLMGAATSKRGLYMAFNRSIADEAKKRFGPNVMCRTGHSLAFQAVGRHYNERLGTAARIPARETARLLGITQKLPVASHQIAVNHQARLVMGMIRRFCFSTDRELMARHLEPVNGLDWEAQQFVAGELLPLAVKAWQDICDPRGRLRFEHDHYMKMWALSRPTLPGEFVLLDEAQDTNPVLEEIFLNQRAQRVCVGDPAQQIYAWRSARDVMTGFPGEHLGLTQSWRFGERIAEVANRWLRHAESEMRLTGRGPAESKVGEVARPDAVLCRGNADAMTEVLKFLAAGVPVALTGGGAALERIAEAANQLKAGRRTSHPELFLFKDWGEVQEYVATDQSGQDLKAIVDLVDTYGPDRIISAVKQLSSEKDAKVTVSTAHKAKGREWGSVRIGAGFTPPGVDEDGRRRPLNVAEARLIYVAASRAKNVLDPAGVAWIDAYEKQEAAAKARWGDRDEDGYRLSDLPLTGQLAHPASPVSRFLAEHLPDYRAALADYQRRIASLPHPVQPIDVQRPAWWALGHAIDYRLRASLGGRLGSADSALAGGVRALSTRRSIPGGPAKAGLEALEVAGKHLLHLLDTRPVGADGEEQLVRWCFVAGYFEDIFRSGIVRQGSILADATAATTLEDLAAGVPPYAVEDIASQMRLAEEPFASFRALPAERRICGPTFAGSADLAGADADFILDGLLLDNKATRSPRRLGREEIYQLAGYLLLDYDDAFGIDRVGLYLSRQGGLIDWPVDAFLKLLGAVAPLPELRAQLQQTLSEIAEEPDPVQLLPSQDTRSVIRRLVGG